MIGDFLLLGENISKTYGPTRALSNVNVALRSGEIVGLVGENGSGKSTLLRLLAGIEPPDKGAIKMGGVDVPRYGLAGSAELGIGVVFQELALIPNLRVFENFFLPAPRLSYECGFLRTSWLRQACQQACLRYGLNCDPDDWIADLPFDQRQLLEIVRALELPRLLGASHRVLLLDEPTTALSYTGVERLMGILRSARESGAAIVFVSHRLAENMSLADRLVVLRDGHLVAETATRGTTERDLHRLMVGRERSEDYYHRNEHGEISQDWALELQDVIGENFRDIRLRVHLGEIVGVAGLSTSGKSELCEAIHGLRPVTSGQMRMCGVDIMQKSVHARVAMGMAFLPKERLVAGLIETASIRSTVGLQLLQRRMFVDRAAEAQVASEMVARFRIKAGSIEAQAGSLSGGNQQKVAIGKWLANQPRLWILDNPTRGVDVGARTEIYLAVRRAAAAGAGLLMASDEITELLGMCDRIYAMQDGAIRAEIDPGQLTRTSTDLEREVVMHIV